MVAGLRELSAAALLVCLTGCAATATVLKEDAAELTVATGRVVAAGRDFYGELQTARRDFLLEIMAHDANCGFALTVVLLDDPDAATGARCLTAAERVAWRDCAFTDDAATDCPGGMPDALADAEPYELLDGGHQGALRLIAVFTAYQTELARILEDPEYDAAAPMLALLENARSAERLFAALEQRDPRGLAYDKQAKALGALIDLLAKSAQDRRDLAAMRALMAAPDSAGAKFEQALDELRRRYGSADRPLFDALALAALDTRIRRYEERAGKLAPDDRLRQMRPIAESHAGYRALADAPDALGQMLAALQESHRQLRTAVVDGELSAEQRRRVARESLRQLRAWFDAIASVITVSRI
jgi:hypothetical protein